MKATLENIKHLTRDEQSAVKVIASTINTPSKCDSMEKALEWASVLSPWFIYQGGNHIAIHAKNGDPRRIMLVTNS
jgi:hypothetical protein